MRLLKKLLIAIFVIYLVPTFASAGWWALKERPQRWSEANWGSAGILPKPEKSTRRRSISSRPRPAG